MIGATGHRNLADRTSWDWVAGEISCALAEIGRPLTGISSLAIGADQLFAETMLEQGGELQIVLPFPDYERTFDPADRGRYHALLKRAAAVEVLPAQESDEESYMAAGRRVVDLSDLLVAVWDGEKAAGLGGTGDVVEYARATGKEVLHIDPLRRSVVRLS